MDLFFLLNNNSIDGNNECQTLSAHVSRARPSAVCLSLSPLHGVPVW
jgi:hypothetical protein